MGREGRPEGCAESGQVTGAGPLLGTVIATATYRSIGISLMARAPTENSRQDLVHHFLRL